jgi:hypothetical protein
MKKISEFLSETGNEVFDDSGTLVPFVAAELKKISERIRRVTSGGADWSMTAVWELPGVIDRDENEGSYAFGFVVVDHDLNVVLEKRFYNSDYETIRDEDLFTARNDSELAQLFDRVRKIVNKEPLNIEESNNVVDMKYGQRQAPDFVWKLIRTKGDLSTTTSTLDAIVRDVRIHNSKHTTDFVNELLVVKQKIEDLVSDINLITKNMRTVL